MQIAFEKYQGTGNDFIIIDIRNHAIPSSVDTVAALCDRHFGIGADGLILLDNSDGFDFKMRYFNADGLEASMCGNGGRCIVAFAHKHGIIREETSFLAVDGEHHAEIRSHEGSLYQVRLKMQDVESSHWNSNEIFLQTGSPHLVQICQDIVHKDIKSDGKSLRYDPRFGDEGTNVNFIEEKEGHLHIRTYERGVEDETLSCGTGATAAAIGWAIKQQTNSPIDLHSKGGKLQISFTKEDKMFKEVFLSGPAEFVFSGKIEI